LALAKNYAVWLKPLKTKPILSLQLKLEAIDALKTEFIEYKKSTFFIILKKI
jgi:hypothetical protein